jgi:hypothetical protein
MKNNKVKAELDAILANLMTDKKMRESDKMLIAHDDTWRKKISDTLKGKTLEEMLGKERADAGKEARRQANAKIDYTERRAKGAQTRRASGGYDVGTMTGKQHNESTKSKMSIKAEIRQELKRQHGLGKSDKVPQELLAKAYKKAGLI